MKGKLAFVLGAAVGYVLGARAGRERYEQIKRRADKLWNTEPVQRSVSAVRDVVDDRIDELKDLAKRVGADVVNNVAQKAGTSTRPSGSAAHTHASEKTKPKTSAKSKESQNSDASARDRASAQKTDTKKSESDS
ncbi:YtxH domain-containing protein [Leucobacter sp. W1478]|uniref:YtxH domain-containing protein n=1 Tax=Leucobacter sp. W1478 TaxID=3439065 RepID=UPI003F369903